MSYSLDANENDAIQILIHISKPYSAICSSTTLGPWIGSQAAQVTPLIKQKREDTQIATPRKRSSLQNQSRVYTFQHFSDIQQYMEAYNEKHTAKNQTNPFVTRYMGIPQTFISLPHPDCSRSALRYVEDRNRYPIPVALGRSHDGKTNSTPNLCLLPSEGTTHHLPPLEVQRMPSEKQEKEKRFVYPKNVVYIDPNNSNFFAETALQVLSSNVNAIKFEQPYDKFKGRMVSQNDSKYLKQSSRKLEKLLVTCENDALNLENMIESLCKSIPSVKQEHEAVPSDKLTKKRNKENTFISKELSYSPSFEQINDSLLNQLASDGNKVDYDSPLDLQFDGRIYHTNLETFLQCLDQKLQNSSKGSIEDLMNSIHVHTAVPAVRQEPVLSTRCVSRKVTRPKSLIADHILELGGKKAQVNINARKKKIY